MLCLQVNRELSSLLSCRKMFACLCSCLVRRSADLRRPYEPLAEAWPPPRLRRLPWVNQRPWSTWKSTMNRCTRQCSRTIMLEFSRWTALGTKTQCSTGIAKTASSSSLERPRYCCTTHRHAGCLGRSFTVAVWQEVLLLYCLKFDHMNIRNGKTGYSST